LLATVSALQKFLDDLAERLIALFAQYTRDGLLEKGGGRHMTIIDPLDHQTSLILEHTEGIVPSARVAVRHEKAGDRPLRPEPGL